jgi:hypothetical protein
LKALRPIPALLSFFAERRSFVIRRLLGALIAFSRLLFQLGDDPIRRNKSLFHTRMYENPNRNVPIVDIASDT